MRIEHFQKGGRVEFRLSGSLDGSSEAFRLCRLVESATSRSEVRRIVLRLRDVPTLDAAGVGLLVRIYETTHLAEISLELREVQPVHRDLLEVCGLLDLFDLTLASKASRSRASGAWRGAGGEPRSGILSAECDSDAPPLSPRLARR